MDFNKTNDTKVMPANVKAVQTPVLGMDNIISNNNNVQNNVPNAKAGVGGETAPNISMGTGLAGMFVNTGYRNMWQPNANKGLSYQVTGGATNLI